MGCERAAGYDFAAPFPLKACLTGLRYIYTISKIASAKIKQAHHGGAAAGGRFSPAIDCIPYAPS